MGAVFRVGCPGLGYCDRPSSEHLADRPMAGKRLGGRLSARLLDMRDVFSWQPVAHNAIKAQWLWEVRPKSYGERNVIPDFWVSLWRITWRTNKVFA